MTMTLIDHRRRFVWGAGLLGLGARCLAIAAEMHDRMIFWSSLGRLSSRQLRDTGLTHNDVTATCCGPISQQAATELRRLAEVRAGNW